MYPTLVSYPGYWSLQFFSSRMEGILYLKKADFFNFLQSWEFAALSLLAAMLMTGLNQ